MRCTHAITIVDKPQFEILSVDGFVKPEESGNVTVEIINRGWRRERC